MSAAAQAGVLRRAWMDVAANAAPQLADLPTLLDQRLSDLEGAGALDEASLLAVAEEASQYALEQGAGEVARALSKRLRRAIYEFLLALDAVNPAETAALTTPAAPAEPRTPVAFTPADVPGADEPAAAPAPPPAPVPLWEAVAPPPRVREVYRVAAPGVETGEGAAAADAQPEAVSEPVVDEPAVDEMGAEPHAVAAEFADAESGAEAAEAQVVEAEAHTGAVMDALAAAAQAEADLAEAAAARAAFEAEQANAAEAVVNGAVEAAEGSEPFAAVHPLGNATVAGAPTEVAAATGSQWTEAASVAEARDRAGAVPAPEWTAEAQAAEGVAPEWAETPGIVPAAEHPTSPDTSVAAELPHAPADEHATAPDATVAAEHREAVDALPAHAAVPVDADPQPTDADPTPASPVEPEPWQAPIVELPVQPAAEPAAWDPAAHADAPPAADTPQLHVVQPDAVPAAPANGAKPPRDLLRVPRQFRRLPPAAHRNGNGSTPHTPVEEPAATLPQATPEPDTTELEDDTLGVPAVPWMLAQPPAPEPEPEPEPPAPQAEEPEHSEEDMGVPFGPFAFAGDDADADLPRPPALAEEPLHPLPGATPAAGLFIQPLPGNDAPQLWTPGPVPTPDYALPRQPAAEPFPIAPLEGFHLTDPGALDLDPAAANPFLTQTDVPAAVPPAPPAPAAPEQPAAHEVHPAQEGHPGDDGAWRVRQSPRAQLLAERMAQKRREEAARAAFEAASFHDDDRDHRHGRKRGRQEEALPDLPTARRQLDEHLRKKRGAEAGALLQRLAQELGGRDIADLALDSGDRCRALGQSRSATNCYLAAWRADPLYETPLWRLSDVCLNDQEIDLAVGYLERIAELMRSRGDDEGAIGVYRKIAMIAPERQDVRDVIRLAKTTGRLDG